MIQFTATESGGGAGPSRGNGPPVEDFLIGPENRLVGQVVAAVREFATGCGTAAGAPAAWLNPLVIVGPPGSGKSHLVRGLASLVATAWSDPGEVNTTTAADFAAQYAAAAHEDSLPALRDRIRQARFWAVEDLGRLPQRRAVQAEFIQMLDEHLQQGTLFVATSCRPPQQVTNLAAALRSRLEGGLLLGLSNPGLSTRREFLRRTAAMQHLPLEPSELDDLARRIPGTPRQLLGEIQRRKLAYVSGADGRPVTGAAEDASATTTAPTVTMGSVLAVTARYFGVSQAAMKSASRRRSVVHARSVAMYLARELAGATLQEIGAVFGGRDHTTVMHACRKVDRYTLEETAVQEEVSDLRRLLLTA